MGWEVRIRIYALSVEVGEGNCKELEANLSLLPEDQAEIHATKEMIKPILNDAESLLKQSFGRWVQRVERTVLYGVETSGKLYPEELEKFYPAMREWTKKYPLVEFGVMFWEDGNYCGVPPFPYDDHAYFKNGKLLNPLE